MPKFKELISIKFKGKTLQAIGYRLAARNKLDCMIYSNLQTSHTKDLSDDSKIKLEQYQELKKCNEQWLKDNKHAAIVLRIYDPETNTYYESTNFITHRSKSIWDATIREYKTPIQITKDFYVIIQGKSKWFLCKRFRFKFRLGIINFWWRNELSCKFRW